MPIKPINRHRYPSDWAAISDSIKMRAGHRCEWPGCGISNYSVGFWTKPTYGRPTWVSDRDVFSNYREAKQFAAEHTLGDGPKLIVIVLTVAHLDHQPENCDPANLRAWCQQHHLAYDLAHHKATAYMTRRERAQTLELPL